VHASEMMLMGANIRVKVYCDLCGTAELSGTVVQAGVFAGNAGLWLAGLVASDETLI